MSHNTVTPITIYDNHICCRVTTNICQSRNVHCVAPRNWALLLPLLLDINICGLGFVLATSAVNYNAGDKYVLKLESVHVVVAGSTDPFQDDSVDCVVPVTPPRVNAEKNSVKLPLSLCVSEIVGIQYASCTTVHEVWCCVR